MTKEKVFYQLRRLLHRILLKLTVVGIKITNLNMLDCAHSEMGIANSGNLEYTGEEYLVRDILKKKLSPRKKYIFFDIGANIGEYSALLRTYFEEADIYSFEPNPQPYKTLKTLSEKANIVAENIGLGEKINPKNVLFTYKKLTATQLGTTNKEILKNYHTDEEREDISFYSDTLDNYCSLKKIEEIDFIKVDVEGAELAVLKGAENLLKKNKINIIQFEFNEPNVANRVFLKDFYSLLQNFDFFRVKKGSLIPLGEYNAVNEIFRLQNILAVKKSLPENQAEPIIINDYKRLEDEIKAGEKKTKLHFGCGPRVLKGWTNIDLFYVPYEKYLKYFTDEHYGAEVRGDRKDFYAIDVVKQKLPLSDESADVIFHEDFIEHLDQKEQILFLSETFRILKKGGIHRVNTPDLESSMKKHSNFRLGYAGVYQNEWDQHAHKNILTKQSLEKIASMIGYSKIIFNSKGKSVSDLMPTEYRPGDGRPLDGNIFADLIK